MLVISSTVSIPDNEIEMSAIGAQGSGGQNVNKLASAIHLRFDIKGSSLPERYKLSLLDSGDKRISKEGVLIIKAQRFRTQQKNREDALVRLKDILKQASVTKKKRKATKPTKGSQRRRMDSKTLKGRTKSLRGPVRD